MSTPYTTHAATCAGGPTGARGNGQAATTGEGGNLQRVLVAQLPAAVRQAICTLLVGQGLDAQKCERILEQLLRYARVWQRSLEEGGDVAVISIGNLLQVHKRDRWTCCCYQTANTFIRLLCALHLLRRHRGPGGVTEYYLPLAEDFAFQPDDDMLTALGRLCDPAQTKNKRVRGKAADVKSRLLLLYASSSTLHAQSHAEEAEDAELANLTGKLRDALAQVDRLLHSIGKLEGRTRNQVMAGIGTVLGELFQNVKKSTHVVDSWASGEDLVGKPGVDSVDSRRSGKAARTSKGERESTAVVDSAPGLKQNPPLVTGAEKAAGEAGEAGREGEDTLQNLPTSVAAVDSGTPIDNDNTLFTNKTPSSSPPPKKNTTDTTDESSVIDSTGDRKAKLQVKPGCLKFTMGEARDLARDVEHNRGDNFPAYIALSATCTRQVIRAAVVNMLAHRYFPDLDGSRDADLDGEVTGKWGVPRRPGAWVTDQARAYQQSGIPRVMELLLSCFVGREGECSPYSYQRIEQQLRDLAQRKTPDEFWYSLQQELCDQEAANGRAAAEDGAAPTAAGSPAQAGEGMTADEARRLSERVEREGAPFEIAGRPRLQDNIWVVELLVANVAEGSGGGVAGDVFTGVLRTEQEWLDYINLVRELES